MDLLRQYQIAFVGLKPGTHQFSFEIDGRFFELFADSLVKKAKIDVQLSFDKQPSFFLLNFILSGTVELPCDRCSAEIQFPIDSEYPIVVKFDEHDDEEKDDSMADVVYINHGDSHLDVSQLIYEFINLSFPLNHVTCDNLRGKKPCNNEILKLLNKPPEEKQDTRDPRWDKLTKIKFN